MNKKSSEFDREAYEEYARKMRLWEDGPTTTNFAQLTAKGVELPAPDALADDKVRAKVWEVIGELANRQIYLDHTDHLSDRELYVKLWNDILREEVPEVDIGGEFVQVLRPDDEADMKTYVRFFADDVFRSAWVEDDSNAPLPEKETPPFNRDALLPPNHVHGWPEASNWLRANWCPAAFAANRFVTTTAALDFVAQLYAAGAESVGIDNMQMLRQRDWAPYADTLIIHMPEVPAARDALMELIRTVGRPDDIADDPMRFGEQRCHRIRLKWQ